MGVSLSHILNETICYNQFKRETEKRLFRESKTENREETGEENKRNE